MSKLGMVSSFDPHSMCKRVERVTAKTGRTSCTNWTISFGVSGLWTRTHLLHWHIIFLNLLQIQTFLLSVRTIQSNVINFQHFLTSFAIFHAFNDFYAKWPWSWKALQITLKRLKAGMVSSFHPNSMCLKVQRVTTKTGCTSCTKRTISFEVSGFHTETHLLHGYSRSKASSQ